MLFILIYITTAAVVRSIRCRMNQWVADIMTYLLSTVPYNVFKFWLEQIQSRRQTYSILPLLSQELIQ